MHSFHIASFEAILACLQRFCICPCPDIGSGGLCSLYFHSLGTYCLLLHAIDYQYRKINYLLSLQRSNAQRQCLTHLIANMVNYFGNELTYFDASDLEHFDGYVSTEKRHTRFDTV